MAPTKERKMNKRLIGYWLVTALFCLAMTAGGSMNLLRAEMQKEAMTALGYPEYLMTILGVAKILGVIALIIPGVPLLKEWAYAGFTFDLLGAAASHAFVSDPIAETIIPLVILSIAIASYCLRPENRRLQFATDSPPLRTE
jgi:uncharacterized membrane protein YphA (DoxX/SURF4 family)